MSEFKGTPGPWGFGNTTDDKRLVLGFGGDRRYVCSVQIHQFPRHMGTHDEPEREANARLIAAAPRLLAALEQIKVLAPPGTLFRVEAEEAIAEATGAAP